MAGAPTAGRAVSFGRRIADLAAAHPDAPALVFAPRQGPERVVSWRELDSLGNRLARLLAGHGAGAGAVVAVALTNSVEHLAAAIGAWRLGACVLPLRWDLPAWERDRLLEVAAPDLVVGDWPLGDRGIPTIPRAAIDDATDPADPRLPDGPLPDAVADPAMAIASSGSTGFPKIIVSPGPGVYDAARPAYATSQQMGAGRGQVQLVPAPLYHTNGFRIAHGSLHRDELLVLMEHFDAQQAVSLIERHRVTTTTMAPVMLLRIARLPGVERRDLSSLRSVLQGAASCPPWLVRWWIDRIGPERFFVSYGSTERVGVAFLKGTEWLEHPGSVGRGLDTDIRILDDAGRDLAAGEIGHVYLRSRDADGPSYRYRGAEPAPTTDDGFTTVGDLGWLDEDGYLYIADRRLDLIVTGGVNVYPSEVEAALVEHPGVADAAVVGVPDEEWGQRLHAVVEPSDRARAPTDDVLRDHCRARLAPHKVPKTFEVVDALPRTAAGKLNRSMLAGERAPDRR